MKVTRKSTLTGITRTLNLNISEDEIIYYSKGALIQDAFPHLSPEEREFFMTGITAEEWVEHFGTEDETEIEK